MKAETLWKKFCEEKNVDINEYYEAWAFCDGGPSSEALLKLVLSGKKFGTASLYEKEKGESIRIPGQREYSVILDSKGEAACVVRDFDVKVEPFLRVSDYHGYSEGEEDRNLSSFRCIHSEFWKEDVKRIGLEKAEDCKVVIEKFTVEYVAEGYEYNPDILSDFFLIEPCDRYLEEIRAYRKEMIDSNSEMDGCLSLKRMEDPKEWADYCYEWGNPLRELSENGVKGTLLMLIRKSDDKLVGMTQIMNLPKSHPLFLVGNIGYSIRPSERRKGYAKLLLKKALDYTKAGYGIEHPILSAEPQNEASKRTILANGGEYLETVFIEEEKVTLERYKF